MALKIEAKMGKLYAFPLVLTAVDQASKFFILDLIFIDQSRLNLKLFSLKKLLFYALLRSNYIQ